MIRNYIIIDQLWYFCADYGGRDLWEMSKPSKSKLQALDIFPKRLADELDIIAVDVSSSVHHPVEPI